MPGKDYASTRFSALNQITPANVERLSVAFTFSTATTHGYEAPPLVVNGTMYLITPWPNYLYALDLTKPGAPAKWTFEPKPAAASQGVACCGTVNRGAVYDAGNALQNVREATGAVGPPLDGIAGRVIIAGHLANTPQNMERWIRDPQHVSPGTAMPNLGVGEADARDITAFLYAREK